MKTLAELQEEVMLGLPVCAPEGEDGMSYVFRKRRSGPIIYAYGYAPSKWTIYPDVCLIREDEPDFNPSDYANLLADFAGTTQQPIWQTCVIPDELMARFLAEADEHERRWR